MFSCFVVFLGIEATPEGDTVPLHWKKPNSILRRHVGPQYLPDNSDYAPSEDQLGSQVFSTYRPEQIPVPEDSLDYPEPTTSPLPPLSREELSDRLLANETENSIVKPITEDSRSEDNLSLVVSNDEEVVEKPPSHPAGSIAEEVPSKKVELSIHAIWIEMTIVTVIIICVVVLIIIILIYVINHVLNNSNRKCQKFNQHSFAVYRPTLEGDYIFKK